MLSKLDFDYFWTEPETRLNRFDQIDAWLSQIVVAGAQFVLLGTQEGYTWGRVAADDGDFKQIVGFGDSGERFGSDTKFDAGQQ